MCASVMDLDKFIASFASRTGDAIAIGFRKPDEDEARIVWVNDTFETMFGFSRTEILGRYVSEMNDPDDREAFLEQINPQIAEGRRFLQAETFCLDKHKNRIWTSLSMFVSEVEGGRVFASTFRDLTELKRREEAAAHAVQERDTAFHEMAALQSRFRDAINAVPHPMSIWDADHRMLIANPAFDTALSQQDGTVQSITTLREAIYWTFMRGQNDYTSSPERLEYVLDKTMAEICRRPQSFVHHHDSGQVFQTSTHRTETGETIVISIDVTEIESARLRLETHAKELERANENSQHQALHDELTGLGNRRKLSEHLQALAAAGGNARGEICSLHIDLDRFKYVNDTKGHAVGDAVLEEVARILRHLAGPEDLLARIGGDEFVILHPRSGELQSPEYLAQRIVQDVSAPMVIEGHEVRIGASVGIATTAISSLDRLLMDSDVALYKAKRLGRNRAERFDLEDQRAHEWTKKLSDDLLRGVEQLDIVPFYQPQVCAVTGELTGFEALARWRHPELGLQTPDVFLHLAEELNVLEQVDEIMFATAIQEMSALFEGDVMPSLSFNVSQQRLLSQSLVRDAQRTRMYPGQVAFELLETVFLDEGDMDVRLQLDALLEAGVHIEIDDFGSGHASIIALEQVAPHRLKIDRRLIAPITRSQRALQMVRSIVEIGHALDIAVTAEGVETEEHARRLAELGCDRLQGDYFGKATAFEDLGGVIDDLERRARNQPILRRRAGPKFTTAPNWFAS